MGIEPSVMGPSYGVNSRVHQHFAVTTYKKSNPFMLGFKSFWKQSPPLPLIPQMGDVLIYFFWMIAEGPWSEDMD